MGMEIIKWFDHSLFPWHMPNHVHAKLVQIFSVALFLSHHCFATEIGVCVLANCTWIEFEFVKIYRDRNENVHTFVGNILISLVICPSSAAFVVVCLRYTTIEQRCDSKKSMITTSIFSHVNHFRSAWLVQFGFCYAAFENLKSNGLVSKWVTQWTSSISWYFN